ncbi:MAG: DUF4118 domain-containing protein, partial [Armatimonadetes bacterium]|nr:DUF4118 domain-containing protein [Armatimonadota bacterium]
MIRSTGRAARSEARETLALPGATGYAAAVFGVALVSVLARALRPGLDASHTSLLYLVVVAVVAYGAGAGPAVLGAFLSFLSWTYFFIEPTGTFYV